MGGFFRLPKFFNIFDEKQENGLICRIYSCIVKGGLLMITKYVKFDYFQVTCRPKGAPESVRDGVYDLRNILKQWENMDLHDRTVTYKQEQARLETFNYNPDSGYLWDMYFGRLRDFNIPSRAFVNSPSEPIDLDDDEYIGENVSAIYDENHYIIMIQRNRYSLGPSAIEEYINTFVYDDEEINLRPIKIPNPVGKFKSAEYVRKLRVKFADVNKVHELGDNKPSLTKWVGILNEYEPINAEIILSVGRKGKKSLGGNLRGFVEELLENKEYVSKAEASLKKDDLSEVEVVDLFDENAHDITTFTVPPRTTLNHEAVIYEMKELYEKRKMEIANILYNE